MIDWNPIFQRHITEHPGFAVADRLLASLLLATVDWQWFFNNLLELHLRGAVFCEIHETLTELTRVWAGTPQELWEYQQEVSTLCHPLFATIPSYLRSEPEATGRPHFRGSKLASR